jgi:hypothetical protein
MPNGSNATQSPRHPQKANLLIGNQQRKKRSEESEKNMKNRDQKDEDISISGEFSSTICQPLKFKD